MTALHPSQAESPPETRNEAPVEVFNRTITVLRGNFLGMDAVNRARRAEAMIGEELDRGGKVRVHIEAIPQGRLITLNSRRALILSATDPDPLQRETLDEAAAKAAKMLEVVVRETTEARSFNAQMRALGVVGAATLVLGLLLWGCLKLRRILSERLLKLAETRGHRIALAGEALIRREHLLDLVRWLMRLTFGCVALLLLNQWLSISLIQFPYTRPWGEELDRFLINLLLGMLGKIAGAIPNLLIAFIIFMIARWVVRFMSAVLRRVERREIAVSWLDPDTVVPTRKLTATTIWIFALAMAYPYLPGAQTEAFKGLSVLIGLMVSLGASSLVGQGASGLILIYTHTMKVGEYVKIGEIEGTVFAIGMFATRIRTGLGEEVTLSNSQILGSVTKNYSRTVQGAGYIVDTSVTIGYDTPWRQVEAMLIEAARATQGVLTEPAPRVFQTALSDFYVEYRLVCQAIPAEPRPRAEVLAALHAAIQDEFNRHGVQIMSPHYLADPASPKIVAPADWHVAPGAAPRQSDTRS
ncbi:mechanosensitive ion channel family protein [Niveibacterium terrae]|uniref:mechanosensitive ion channel family protein n=1 Tax=Niveibacterium terrae TaxID=3373598 RepID=UPI003A903FC4